jgi:hypothetical protein
VFAVRKNYTWLALATVAGLLWWRKCRSYWLLVAVPVAAAGYSVWTGGDVWTADMHGSRPVLTVLPFLLAATAVGLTRLSALLPRAWLVLTGGSLVVVLAVNPVSRLLMVERADWYESGHAVKAVELGLFLNQCTEDSTVVGVTSAGAIAYYARRPMRDMLGKMDSHIAGLPCRGRRAGKNPWLDYMPGHLKYDPEYTVNAQRPDLICSLWDEYGDWYRAMDGKYEAATVHLSNGALEVFTRWSPFAPSEAHFDLAHADAVGPQPTARPDALTRRQAGVR